jgi:hypothetical protein
MQNYRIDIGQYQQNINIISDCNNITFINTGTIDVQVNTFTIVAGASLSIGGNAEEIDRTIYTINFQGATNGNVVVIRKIFQ